MSRIFITGANRGIGLEFVRHYMRAGDTVYAGCRHPEKAHELKELAEESADGRLELVQLDVVDEQSIRDAAAKVQEEEGALDLLINNAGIADFSNFDTISSDIMLRVFRTNVCGPLLVTKAFVPLLEKGDDPLVFNISSKMGSMTWKDDIGQPGGDYAYSVSKAGLNMLNKQLSIDLKKRKIAVVAASPGWVRTDMGGSNADLSPRESVDSMTAAICKLGMAETGTFVDLDGTRLEY